MILQKGAGAAKQDLGGALSCTNAARFVGRTVKKFRLALNARISKHLFAQGAEVFELPYIRPADLLTCVLEECPQLWLGGYDLRDARVPTLFNGFWARYKHYQPGHDVYRFDASRLPFTLPYTLHGDGGRTQKKQPLDMLSLHPAVGVTTSDGEALECRCPTTCKYCEHRLNSKLSTYLTHFLVVAFPSKQWPQGLLVDFIKNLSQQLGELHTHGLEIKGQRFFFSCIGFRADMEFHIKCLWESGLSRSYEHCGRVNELMVCHECHAGAPEVPFEDCNFQARWESTVGESLPWATTPPFHPIRFEDGTAGKAPLFFRRDPFHVFRLGFLAHTASL